MKCKKEDKYKKVYFIKVSRNQILSYLDVKYAYFGQKLMIWWGGNHTLIQNMVKAPKNTKKVRLNMNFSKSLTQFWMGSVIMIFWRGGEGSPISGG